MLGKTENLIILLVIILLLFGAKKLPELAKSIGQAGKEIRKGFEGGDDEEDAKKSSSKKSGK